MATKKTTVRRKKVTFEYHAEPGLEVFVAGSFNSWDETAKQLKDIDGKGEYKAVAMIPAGSYEYKFKVGGQWCIDPSNPNISKNVHGTLNNVLIVE
ncbi:MAG: glycogen-binding domain-containing protein [Phycisphaerae bacterium]|jgi:1,4-alpha-glucan branching enzyme